MARGEDAQGAEDAMAARSADGNAPTVTRCMPVQVVCALAPQRLLRMHLQLPVGATVLDALRASGLAQQLPAGQLDSLQLGLWGRACAPDTVLQPDDRVELTRALTVDPKEARRLRYRRDGVRRKPPLRRA